jgi:hypothetical protein
MAVEGLKKAIEDYEERNYNSKTPKSVKTVKIIKKSPKKSPKKVVKKIIKKA